MLSAPPLFWFALQMSSKSDSKPLYSNRAKVRAALSESTPLLPPLIHIVCGYCPVERDWSRAVCTHTYAITDVPNAAPFGLCYDEARGRLACADNGAARVFSIAAD